MLKVCDNRDKNVVGSHLPIVVSSLLRSSFNDGSHRGLLFFQVGAFHLWDHRQDQGKVQDRKKANKILANTSAHLLKLAVDLLSKRCERSGRLFVVHRRWCRLVVSRLLGESS